MKLINYSNRIRYEIQLTMPVDNPENNVFVTVRKGVHIFEVPSNTQNIHSISLMDLIDAANNTELLRLSTALNNRVSEVQRKVHYGKEIQRRETETPDGAFQPVAYRLAPVRPEGDSPSFFNGRRSRGPVRGRRGD